MAIQGLRYSGVTGGTGAANDFVAGQRPLSWREGILLLYPNGAAPLTALTAAMDSKAITDPEHNWWEKSLASQRVVLTTSINTTATTLTCSGGGCKSIPVGAMLLAEESGELMRVTTVDSDTQLTVVRQYNGDKTTGTAITLTGTGVNPNILCVGTAFPEGSTAPGGLNFDPTKRTNYLQIFRNTLEMTRTAMKSRLRTGDAVREAKRECLEYHSIQMERAWFWGKKSEAAVGGVPVRTTSGILGWLQAYASANVVTAEASMTLAMLENHLRLAFAYGSSEKMAFLGNRAMMLLQQIIRLGTNIHYNIKTGEKEFGMNVSRLTTPFGELVLKTHPLFNQVTGGTSGSTPGPYYGYESSIWILDMDKIKYRYLTDSDTKYEAKYETPGLDGMKSGYITEAGLEIQHPETHYIIRGMSTVAAG